jgi:hypothetical protein
VSTATECVLIGFCVGILLGAIASRSAYYNGVNDGYGYSQDPGCPGYRKAGKWLFRYMRHRWSVPQPPQ